MILRFSELLCLAFFQRENQISRHMAIMAYLLKEYSNEPIDIARTKQCV